MKKMYWKIRGMLNDKRGMGTIEVVLIVAILVALALLFKTFINNYANTIFDTISQKTNDALANW